ncbi:bifunctional lysylphosphatidylglycerol flippase/synthetase MprF [Paenarthrobacter sp. NPDC018779]|uniref:bifunctional lysylphosphatidylglycerol flippase/synthetase MprF n=1 Tax=Paenarthrobacter sp. NPDC018779 TaxID=3364375 RepID=UPI0037CCB36E
MSAAVGLRGTVRGAAALRRLPLTLGLIAILWIIGAVTGSVLAGPSEPLLEQVGLGLAVEPGPWWSVFTSGFFASSLLDYLACTAMILVAVGIAERTMGPWLALAAFVAGTALSALVVVVLVEFGTDNSDQWLSFLGGEYVVGAYGGAAAALGCSTAALEALWRRRLRTWLLAATLMFALFVGVAQTLQALAGAVIGILAGWGIQSLVLRRKAGSFHSSSLRETRFLVGTVVGVFALGPLLTQVTGTLEVGPLSVVSQVMLQASPTMDEVQEACDNDKSCVTLQSVVGVQSFGATILTVIPVLLLLVCAEGLRRGRRLAYRLTLAIQLYLAAVTTFTIVQYATDPEVTLGSDDVGFLLLYAVPAILAPLIIAFLLLGNRHKFRVESSDAGYRVLGRTTLAMTGAAVILYSASWFLEGNPDRSTPWDLLGQLTHILVPFPVPFVTELPQGLVSTVLYGLGGDVIWLCILLLVLNNFQRFRTLATDPAADLGHARELIHDGGNSLSWMALWDNNQYWFTPDRKAGLAYQVHNGIALTVAGPFGSKEHHSGAATGFLSHCATLGLTPCFYSATDELDAALLPRDFRKLEVAEETLLNVQTLTFKGKEWQNVRTALNRAEKLSIKDHWHHYHLMPPGIRAQLAEISEEWVADKALPEMGFTLGGLDELKDPEVLCCVAVDDDGLVHGVTSWLPVFSDGVVSGWTLDFMRRRTTGFKGVMEFLIASAVTHFKEDVPQISLSGSPLANTGSAPDDGDHSALDRVLALLGNALEPMYGFKSLAAFKSRFQPEHRTLYMYYRDPLSLPAIGLAVGSAYLPGLSPAQSAGLLRQMVAREAAA